MTQNEFSNNGKHPHDWSTDALIVLFLMLGILTPYLVIYQNTSLIAMLGLTLSMLMLLFISFVVGKISRSTGIRQRARPTARSPKEAFRQTANQVQPKAEREAVSTQRNNRGIRF